MCSARRQGEKTPSFWGACRSSFRTGLVGFDEFWERPRVRELFRWEISGFVIGIFGPIGVAFLLAESHYVGAYLAFAISGFWALCCWPTLGAHIKRRKRGDVKETPKNRALLQEDRRRY